MSPERPPTSSKLLLSVFLIQINDDRVRTFLGFLRSTCGKGFLQGEEPVHFVPHQQHPSLWHPISHHFSTSCHCPARVNRKNTLLLPWLCRKNSSQSKLCWCPVRSPYRHRFYAAASQGWPAAQGLSHHHRHTNCTEDRLARWWWLNSKNQKFNVASKSDNPLRCTHCCSDTKSCLTLRLHWLQHTRFLCPPLSPKVCSNSRPLSQWCHPIISSSATPFSFGLPFPPASGSLPVGRFFASDGQSVHALTIILHLRENCKL